jgi:hypothetical protein
MSGTHASLRIEIVDPAAEPLEGAWIDAAPATASVEGVDEWLRSLADAAAVARGRVEPLVGAAAGIVAWSRKVLHGLQEYSVQLRHDGNPRRGSLVRQHVFEPFDVLTDRLPAVAGAVAVRPGVDLEVTSAFESLPGGGRQAAASLRLRGSWPPLPVMVKVEPWWRAQSVVTVELRNRRRLRYPRRYFRAAHASARAVGRRLAD